MSGNLIESLRQNYSEAEYQIEELRENETAETQRDWSQYQERIDRLRMLGKKIIRGGNTSASA